MIRSLSTAVSGLRNHQIKLDVVGNNIANVNTTAFKSSVVRFQDLFSQTLQGATAPQANRGGINPSQVGLGMRISAIDTIHEGGPIQGTGRDTDLAIEGSGFFVVNDGSRQLYTRDGSFYRDSSGYLVNANGFRLMGWIWDEESGIDTAQPLSAIHIPLGEDMRATPTSYLSFAGNLNASIGGTVYDLVLNDTSALKSLRAEGLFFGNYSVGINDSGGGAVRAELISYYSKQGKDLSSAIDLSGITTVNDEVTQLLRVVSKSGSQMTVEVTELNKLTGKTYTYEMVLKSGGAGGDYELEAENFVGAVVYPDGFTIKNDAEVSDAFLLDFSRPITGQEFTLTAKTGPAENQELVYRKDKFQDGGTLYTIFLNSENGHVKFGSFSPGIGTMIALTDAATFNFLSQVESYDTYVFDSLGERHFITITFAKLAENRWSYTVSHQEGISIDNREGVLVFQENGSLDPGASTITSFSFNPGNGADLVQVLPDFSGIMQLVSPGNVIVREQDGFPAGELVSFNVEKTGIITGTYSSGEVRILGQLALAYFVNPQGLLSQGANLYDVSSNSGEARIGTPGTEGRGYIQSEALEMSNVDLSFEFTEMITTSRAFQANTRVITTSDEVLMEVVNLKR